MKRSSPLYTRYVSPIDRLLAKYHHDHPAPSLSQEQEFNKHKKVFYLRDTEERNESPKKMWDDLT